MSQIRLPADPIVPSDILDHVKHLCLEDLASLKKSEKKYGDSWKRRGGVGAFMMLARKWDRIENTVGADFQFNIFSAIDHDSSSTGILDDIRDLRRYLLLVEAEMIRLGRDK
jgi:hypothetical protein|tara:strand:- start:5361 stop:5696 length:336 start_codon:yes stop_codon:yes gene_type:complete